ncbi:MAG: dihydropteroate synthase [Flavobacteriaceae bacterium]|nr:dihydropteroate synthase [Flavobacteriaceae bacterium]
MTINCKGELIDLACSKVMGILNITPDSFYDGGKFIATKEIIQQTKKMLDQGATFIDIGAYSSRPNAKHISEEEELHRILPVVKLLIHEFPKVLISIDTFRSKVASKCLDLGACMINDISGGNLDKNMFTVIAKYQVPYVLMHMQGNPQNMQQKVTYKDVVQDIIYFFSEKLTKLRKLQINDVILDVGFGFGKTTNQNYEILQKLELFQPFELPILAGLSRKSMLYEFLEEPLDKMLNATSIVNTIALQKGASILRVHDVKEALECIRIIEKTKNK